MNRRALIIVIATFACATARPTVPTAEMGLPPGVTFEGGDGLSCTTRVVVRGAPDGERGIAAEYAWLRANYPAHRVLRQELIDCDQRRSDRISITTADGQDVAIHFDVSEFFGKGLGIPLGD